MKKISIIVGVCIILAAMPMTSAVSLFAPNHASLIQNPARPTFTNGTFSGVFAMKNESGYIPLGDFNGTYDVGGWFGSFAGTWTMDEGNVSGTMSGWVLGYIVYGIINTTGGNVSNWFLGLYRVNETDNTFTAGAIIFGEDQHYIRYAMGSL
jgi:hypothetical protein